MATNQILPFAPTDTGSNLTPQATYSVSTARISGVSPGIADPALYNKAMRQSSFIASQLAQYITDITQTDVSDSGTPAKLLAQLNAAMTFLPIGFQKFVNGSGNYNLRYWFFIASGNATAGATYTNNGVTFTVAETVTAGVRVSMTGSGDPTLGGTLTKASGTGDASLTFYAFRKPTNLSISMIGAGGGGGGGSIVVNSDAGPGGTGGTTTFGTSLLSCTGGGGGQLLGANDLRGGSGGLATISSPAFGMTWNGGLGSAAFQMQPTQGTPCGGTGASTPFSSGGTGAANGGNPRVGQSPTINSGAGGGGGATNAGGAYGSGGGGGGAGGYLTAIIPNPSSIYSYTVGVGGIGGIAGINSSPGGNGASGVILIQEIFN